jgi:hypothetical protein
MTGTVATQVKAIAFERDIEILTEGFPGREWLFEEIYLWFQQDNERLFILAGERGIGKSAIATYLTQTSQHTVAYHFCQVAELETLKPGRIL